MTIRLKMLPFLHWILKFSFTYVQKKKKQQNEKEPFYLLYDGIYKVRVIIPLYFIIFFLF